MPGKSRVEDGHASIQVEMMIPVRQSGRAKAMEKARGPAAPPPLPRIPRVTRLMALAIKFQDMVDRGEVSDYADLARLGHVTRARMSQVMNLLLLAPDIQEAILNLPAARNNTVAAERHVRSLTKFVIWNDQRRLWRVRPKATANVFDSGDLRLRHGRHIGSDETAGAAARPGTMPMRSNPENVAAGE